MPQCRAVAGGGDGGECWPTRNLVQFGVQPSMSGIPCLRIVSPFPAESGHKKEFGSHAPVPGLECLPNSQTSASAPSHSTRVAEPEFRPMSDHRISIFFAPPEGHPSSLFDGVPGRWDPLAMSNSSLHNPRDICHHRPSCQTSAPPASKAAIIAGFPHFTAQCKGVEFA